MLNKLSIFTLLPSCLFRVFVALPRANALKPRAFEGAALMCICFQIRVWLLPTPSRRRAATMGSPLWEKKGCSADIYFGCADSKAEPAGSDVGAPSCIPAKNDTPPAAKTFWSAHSPSNAWRERHVFLHLTGGSHQDLCIYTHAEGAEIFMGADRGCQNPSEALTICVVFLRIFLPRVMRV